MNKDSGLKVLVSADSVSFSDVLVNRKGRVLEKDLFCKGSDTH